LLVSGELAFLITRTWLLQLGFSAWRRAHPHALSPPKPPCFLDLLVFKPWGRFACKKYVQ
jgi:hypothetical protein